MPEDGDSHGIDERAEMSGIGLADGYPLLSLHVGKNHLKSFVIATQLEQKQRATTEKV